MGKIKYSSLSNMDSIITNNLQDCYLCGYTAEHCHHVFEGPDKQFSEQFKLMIPVCTMCHRVIHDEPSQMTNKGLKRIGQIKFEEHYPNLKFLDYFRKNYL